MVSIMYDCKKMFWGNILQISHVISMECTRNVMLNPITCDVILKEKKCLLNKHVHTVSLLSDRPSVLTRHTSSGNSQPALQSLCCHDRRLLSREYFLVHYLQKCWQQQPLAPPPLPLTNPFIVGRAVGLIVRGVSLQCIKCIKGREMHFNFSGVLSLMFWSPTCFGHMSKPVKLNCFLYKFDVILTVHRR